MDRVTFFQYLYVWLNMYRLIGAYLLVLLHPNKEKILYEACYWGKWKKIDIKNKYLMFGYILLRLKEYKNLLIVRLSKNKFQDILVKMMLCLIPSEKTLFINCRDIGWNLFIQHGFSTIITCCSIGENCWINQQVTIGFAFKDSPPTIGNGVRISAGAKVIGDCKIGDNAIIGSNAVVSKDVNDSEVVAGVPARCIGKNTEHILYNQTK